LDLGDSELSNIAPGVTGLLPKSKYRDSLEAQNIEKMKRGDSILVQIDEVLFEQKRISLGVPTEVEDQSWKSAVQSKSGFSNGLGNLATLLNKK
jgi:small subunit ribosomal protein S1